MRSQRDRSSELIVALAVMGTLALGLAFGIILTLSSQVDETAAPSVTAATTAAAAVPSATPSARAPATATRAPSDTPRATVTATTTRMLPPTDTPTERPSATRTSRPGLTATEAARSVTKTRAPRPSATFTPSATHTPRPSATWTPSATPTPTRTDTPSVTPSRTPRPTHTPSVTRTPRPSATWTPSSSATPSATLTFTPYPTLTPSITPFGGEQTRTPSASGCPIPEGWVAYTVQAGDTLFSLARRWGMGTDALAEANCLPDPDAITVGQILYAPPGSDITPRPTSASGGGVGYTRFNCDNPTATISDPRAGAVLRGTVGIYGTATHPNFQFYRLQISGNEQPQDFATLGVYRQQVVEGQLGTLNTAAFAPGEYWLRLTVVDNTANYPPECTVRVRIER